MADPEVSHSDSRLRKDKTDVRKLLESNDIESLNQWAEKDPKLLRVLVSLLYDRDELICFRSADALGRASAIVAKRRLPRIRNLLRRLFWTMNDESGSICWYAPDAIGEILANIPDLIGEYARMLLSFIREEPFDRGVHRAIYRIMLLHPGTIALSAGEMLKSLDDPDASIRGYAVSIMTSMGHEIPANELDRLRRDDSAFTHYEPKKGVFEIRIISDVVREYAKGP